MNSSRPIKFLLVDDLEANLLALEGLLKRDGLEMLKARSGAEALEFLLVHDVALAFVDVQMPEMSGFELAEMMRGTERTRTVPIIFLTAGEVNHQRRIRGYETGAVDFLPKPIDASILLNKAATFFELALQREKLRESEERLREVNDRLEASNAELARADQSKDEFLAMLAHELRNPLAPLRNATMVLQSVACGPVEREKALGLIDRQIDNMSRMIDDLLDVSRITQGKITLRLETVDLGAILQSAAEVVKPMCDEARQTLRVEAVTPAISLRGDATRLEQIFGNLLTNASKYSGEETQISVTAERDPQADEVVVRVKDNGRGIEPEVLPRIFDLFVQASRSLERSQGGLGIGLTVVSRLVKLHGGTIEARSEGLGHGAEFVVRLPVIAETTRTEIEPEASADSQRALRILIVDDNRDSAETMAVLQRLDGHETRVALTGPEAVESAKEFLPEAVLLDIGLPGMDGYEVAKCLRQMPALSDAFLIALTGYGSEDDRARAREAGFNELMVKPADLEVLRSRLGERR